MRQLVQRITKSLGMSRWHSVTINVNVADIGWQHVPDLWCQDMETAGNIKHNWWTKQQYQLTSTQSSSVEPVIRNCGYMSTVMAERHTSYVCVVGTSHELSRRRRKQMTSSNTHIHDNTLPLCTAVTTDTARWVTSLLDVAFRWAEVRSKYRL